VRQDHGIEAERRAIRKEVVPAVRMPSGGFSVIFKRRSSGLPWFSNERCWYSNEGVG
jgi:hypothetical protein